MNALLKKEIRLLLPSFLIGVALTFSNWLLPANSTGFSTALFVLPFLFCPAMAVMMALDSFGSEVSSGTFSNLLAQPVPRARIWRIKTILLAAALVIFGGLWCVFYYLHFVSLTGSNNFWEIAVGAWTFLFVVFSGGLWTVLLLRQVAAAFWFTLLVPGAILVLATSLTSGKSDVYCEVVFVTVLAIYSLAGVWFARWLFLRAQDIQWSGGTIAMPKMGGATWRLANSGTARRWRPRAALWWKEVQLHQSQFIMAGALAFLHLDVIATRKLGHFPKNSATEFVLEGFWCLWLVMPLLVGCAAMAEERKMGTLAGQLCLPIKRRTQFRIKFLVVLMISVTLGIVMPWLLEGNRILPDFHIQKLANGGLYLANSYNRAVDYGSITYFAQTRTGIIVLTLINLLVSLSPCLPFLFMAAICAGIAVIGFYASTLAHNTLQALAPAVFGILLTFFLLIVAAQPYEFGLGFLWRGPLIYLIVTPVMMAVLAWLAYRNSQRPFISTGVWLKNLFTLIISLALVTVATTAIYYRDWELLKPTEPAHGAARWSLANPPQMQINGNSITIRLADGRVWMNRYILSLANPFKLKIVTDSRFGDGKFLEGTNWSEVRDYGWDIVGIQRDGSLWVSEQPDQWSRIWRQGKTPGSQITKLVQFGRDHDWQSVSGRFATLFLLKTNGTLWSWGAYEWKWNKKWPGLHAFTPQRVGTNSVWSKIFTANGRTFFCTTTGQVWVEPAMSTIDEVKKLVPGISINRTPYLENKKWRDVASVGVVIGGPSLVGVFDDGTFREIAATDRIPMTPAISKKMRTSSKPIFTWGLVEKDAQIGTTTNWLALAENNGVTITLKADGTLWKWNFSQRLNNLIEISDLNTASPVQFSIHSDWVAVGQMLNGIVALAADGSLWLWRSDAPAYSSGDFHSWLAPTRRPQLLGNVFDEAE